MPIALHIDGVDNAVALVRLELREVRGLRLVAEKGVANDSIASHETPADELIHEAIRQQRLGAAVGILRGYRLERCPVLVIVDDDEAVWTQEVPEQREVAVDTSVGVVHERS